MSSTFLSLCVKNVCLHQNKNLLNLKSFSEGSRNSSSCTWLIFYSLSGRCDAGTGVLRWWWWSCQSACNTLPACDTQLDWVWMQRWLPQHVGWGGGGAKINDFRVARSRTKGDNNFTAAFQQLPPPPLRNCSHDERFFRQSLDWRWLFWPKHQHLP